MTGPLYPPKKLDPKNHTPKRLSSKSMAQKNIFSRRSFLRLLATGTALGASLNLGSGLNFGAGLAFTQESLESGFLPKGSGMALAAESGGSLSATPQLSGADTGRSVGTGAKNLYASRWGMVIDTRKLTSPERLAGITRACHAFHNVPNLPPPQDLKWIWDEDLQATFTDELGAHLPTSVQNRRFLLLCNHCDNPPCVRVCPTGATFRRNDGIVAMDYHRCIGCRYCMAACPYGSRSFNFQEPRTYLQHINPEYPPRMRGVVEKCTFCMERLSIGKMPLCVEASDGAIVFGDLSDPASAPRALLSGSLALCRKSSLGTVPCVYYIL